MPNCHDSISLWLLRQRSWDLTFLPTYPQRTQGYARRCNDFHMTTAWISRNPHDIICNDSCFILNARPCSRAYVCTWILKCHIPSMRSLVCTFQRETHGNYPVCAILLRKAQISFFHGDTSWVLLYAYHVIMAICNTYETASVHHQCMCVSCSFKYVEPSKVQLY